MGASVQLGISVILFLQKGVQTKLLTITVDTGSWATGQQSIRPLFVFFLPSFFFVHCPLFVVRACHFDHITPPPFFFFTSAVALFVIPLSWKGGEMRTAWPNRQPYMSTSSTLILRSLLTPHFACVLTITSTLQIMDVPFKKKSSSKAACTLARTTFASMLTSLAGLRM